MYVLAVGKNNSRAITRTVTSELWSNMWASVDGNVDNFVWRYNMINAPYLSKFMLSDHIKSEIINYNK